jgi:hypothetical protein
VAAAAGERSEAVQAAAVAGGRQPVNGSAVAGESLLICGCYSFSLQSVTYFFIFFEIKIFISYKRNSYS